MRTVSVSYLAIVIATLSAAFLSRNCQAQPFVIQTDHTNGIYNVSETVTWRIKAIYPYAGDSLDYSIKRGQMKRIDGGTIHLTNGAATLQSTFDAPGTLLADI